MIAQIFVEQCTAAQSIRDIQRRTGRIGSIDLERFFITRLCPAELLRIAQNVAHMADRVRQPQRIATSSINVRCSLVILDRDVVMLQIALRLTKRSQRLCK